jgi:hypothetical protein
MTSLSPRSQTAISIKPSNPQIRTPSTQRVTLVAGMTSDALQSAITPNVMQNRLSGAGFTNTHSFYNHKSSVLQGSNDALLH